MIGKKFHKFLELYNVMEHSFFRTNFLYWVTSLRFHHSNSSLLLYTVALYGKF